MNAGIDVYLDWNATSPPHPDVIEVMRRTALEAWGNPSSVHASGRRAAAIVEAARGTVARALCVQGRDVAFTSGGTEANNLALRAARGLVLSALEHPSITRVGEALARQGRPVEWVPVSSAGRIEPDAVREALDRLPRGSHVALMAVNHETGVIQPVSAVAEVVHAAGGLLHVDAVQALGKLGPNSWLGADSLAVAAHKIRGPKGIGALGWSTPEAAPSAVLLGGAQERGLRPGTVDPVALAGFHTALERLSDRAICPQALGVLRDRVERELSAVAQINGEGAARVPHVTNLSFAGWKGDELVAALDLAGVRVSSGSACSAGTSEPSKVIEAMLGRERARSAVRVSLGETTTAAEIDQALSAWRRVLAARASIPSSVA